MAIYYTEEDARIVKEFMVQAELWRKRGYLDVADQFEQIAKGWHEVCSTYQAILDEYDGKTPKAN